MKTQRIGTSDLTCTRLAYGCWRLAGNEGAGRRDTAEGVRAVHTALDAGYTMFDLADIYGHGECEQIFGAALREQPATRDRIIIATKCGIRPPWDGAQHCYDSSPAHIVKCVERSLQRIGVDRVDLLMIHRPDYLGDVDEIASTFSRLHEQGKVRWFGASNFRPSQLTTLQRACDFPLVAHQVEVSLNALFTLDDGSLDQCVAEKMTPLAWSPLAKGALLAAPRNEREVLLHTRLDDMAARHGTTRGVIALAWVLRHPSRMIPIVGSATPSRIRELVHADEIELSREEWYALLIAARGESLP